MSPVRILLRPGWRPALALILVAVLLAGLRIVWNVLPPVHRAPVDLYEATSPDGRWVVGWKDNNLVLCDVETGKIQRSFGCPGGACVGFSPDGSRLAVADNPVANSTGIASPATTSVTILDLATGAERVVDVGFRDEVHRLSFSDDGQQLAALAYEAFEETEFGLRLTTWDVNTGQKRARLDSFGLGDHVAMNFDAGMLAFASGNSLSFFHLPSGRCWAEVVTNTEEAYLLRLGLSRDGHRAITRHYVPAGNEIVTTWELDPGRETAVKKNSWVASVSCVNSTGNVFATLDAGNMLTVRDLATGQQISTIPMGSQSVGWIDFSPDGTKVAVGNPKVGTVRAYDATTGTTVANVDGTDLESMAFSADGRWLIKNGHEFWPLPPRKPIVVFLAIAVIPVFLVALGVVKILGGAS